MTVGDVTRARVCRAMWSQMNTWMPEFGRTAYAIPKALLDGTLTEAVVTGYPLGQYPEQESREIAHTVGLPFSDDPVQYGPGGWRLNVDTQAIRSGIALLLAIPAADVGIADTTDGGVWQFYAEILDTHGVTIDEVRKVMRGLSLRDAAQLLMDAHSVPTWPRR